MPSNIDIQTKPKYFFFMYHRFFFLLFVIIVWDNNIIKLVCGRRGREVFPFYKKSTKEIDWSYKYSTFTSTFSKIVQSSNIEFANIHEFVQEIIILREKHELGTSIIFEFELAK